MKDHGLCRPVGRGDRVVGWWAGGHVRHVEGRRKGIDCAQSRSVRQTEQGERSLRDDGTY